MAPTGLLESFLAAIQASVSVLLVISYGAAAAKLRILDAKSTKAISRICVRVFLPALLFVKIGSQLDAGAGGSYAVVLVWALACHLVSFLLGLLAHLVLGMPDWVTVAVMFNNSTSYPLLLIGALDDTGILDSLKGGGESTAAAVERAKAYFLVYATVSSCLTFAVGPRLIDSEHGPEDDDEEEEDKAGQDGENRGIQEDGADSEADEHTALLDRDLTLSVPKPSSSPSSFFPSIRRRSSRPRPESKDRRVYVIPLKRWSTFGPRTRWWLVLLADFFNAPFLGAIAGVIVGLVPALHKAFFAETSSGGIFTAWLTASLKNIGNVFVPLPVFVAGVSLYTAVTESRKQKQSSPGSGVPKATVAYVLLVRFVLWPAVSIALVYALASRTDVLGSDPMLWFTMMLMPAGPPASKLVAMVQVSDVEDGEEAAISKILTISYLISPVLSFTVVGSLMASQACK
ncbi:hypothetical protein JX265_000272 [Neoarthrinium moseri]|uniref:Auxin efflux carrier n=1 Tax=Neoarthrinium moseri TaxID=1658444 RepID=A0A9Q0AVE6_9PEZI|nr:hypothetical protein JX265_000272 [Neoarthrinium moseri]